MAIAPRGGVQTHHCAHVVIMRTLQAFFTHSINLYQDRGDQVSRQSLSRSWRNLNKWSQFTFKLSVDKLSSRSFVETELRQKAEISKSVEKSMTRWRLWLEESISMVTAGFAKGIDEVKEARCFFLALIQLNHKLQHWQDCTSRTKQNIKTVG